MKIILFSSLKMQKKERKKRTPEIQQHVLVKLIVHNWLYLHCHHQTDDENVCACMALLIAQLKCVYILQVCNNEVLRLPTKELHILTILSYLPCSNQGIVYLKIRYTIYNTIYNVKICNSLFQQSDCAELFTQWADNSTTFSMRDIYTM